MSRPVGSVNKKNGEVYLPATKRGMFKDTEDFEQFRKRWIEACDIIKKAAEKNPKILDIPLRPMLTIEDIDEGSYYYGQPQ